MEKLRVQERLASPGPFGGDCTDEAPNSCYREAHPVGSSRPRARAAGLHGHVQQPDGRHTMHPLRRHARSPGRSSPGSGGRGVLLAAALLAVPLGCASPEAAGPPGPSEAPGVEARSADASSDGSTESTALQSPTRRATGSEAMVASAHPLATRVGLDVLRAGGNAVDAAVATAFAVGVVEPMMAGIGGSGGMLIWLEEEGRAEYLDFYAVAPSRPDTTFPHYDGPTDTPRGVAVPGTVPGLLEALERYGTLDRAEILAPAIVLAEEGFPVSPLLARTIEGDSAKLTRYRRSQEIFWPRHRPLRAGEILVQPELAATMRRIADEGRAGFDQGEVAREVVQVLNVGGNPMSEADLAGFTPRWRRPLCGVYRGRVVLSAPPPQSGMQIIQTLNLLDGRLDEAGLPDPLSTTSLHLLGSAIRTAAGDRRRFLGDPDRVGVPARGLTSAGFARERAPLVVPEGPPVPPAVPEADPWLHEDEAVPVECEGLDPFQPAPAALRPESDSVDPAAGPDDSSETTHLSVADADGNAVSLTFTQGVYFGTGAWAAGTFLNSGLFIFATEGPNRIAPGKAPASTTTPTILLGEGGVELVVGSPGGGRIPPAVIQTIVYILDYGMDPAAALAMPRINPHFTEPVLQFEQGIGAEPLAGLRRRGWDLRVFPPLSLHFGGAQVLWHDGEEWIGAADPRRDGTAAGF